MRIFHRFSASFPLITAIWFVGLRQRDFCVQHVLPCANNPCFSLAVQDMAVRTRLSHAFEWYTALGGTSVAVYTNDYFVL
ncbi:hypothetical protein BKA83DRAFT_4306658 [Pisolithus microcarpus]|nr:hypothetical protein BKA83DRAFT_4306658 [Pisolithus microcarpus]